MLEIQQLVKLSKYAGERFDLVQAGGGNSSVKLDGGQMLIKASGCLLSEVASDCNFASVDYRLIVSQMEKLPQQKCGQTERDRAGQVILNEALSENVYRPSIETFLHAMLAKYTLHTHPVSVGAVVASLDWQARLSPLFPDALFVPYQTPGLALALALMQALALYRKSVMRMPEIVFIQNHGLIVSADDAQKVMDITDEVVSRVDAMLSYDLTPFKQTTPLSLLLNKVLGLDNITYLSCDRFISDSLFERRDDFFYGPCVPDQVVYCGVAPIEFCDCETEKTVRDYVDRHCSAPKVILYQEHVYFYAKSLKKAQEMEAVFRMHLMMVSDTTTDAQPLSDEECNYLLNWESEKFRQEC